MIRPFLTLGLLLALGVSIMAHTNGEDQSDEEEIVRIEPFDDTISRALDEAYEMYQRDLDEEARREKQERQIEDGIDAQYIPIVKQIDDNFYTDEKGRVIRIGIVQEEDSGYSVNDALQKIEPLRHVQSFTLWQWHDWDGKEKLSEDFFLCIREWKELRTLSIGLSDLHGNIFLKLIKKNPLSHLHSLDIRLKQGDDQMLEAISNCHKLETLTMIPSDLSDAGMAHLAKLKNLQVLNLRDGTLTLQGVAYLSELSQLREASLDTMEFQNVGDAGLEHFSKLVNLKELYCTDPKVTDAGLAHLPKLTKLTDFSVHSPLISAEGLKHLVRLKNLETLHLTDTTIGDEAVPVLSQMTQLKLLFLDDTKFTESGVKKLERALPDCQISHSFERFD